MSSATPGFGNALAQRTAFLAEVLGGRGADLESAERVKQIVQMERIFSQEVPALPLYFTPEVTAFVAGLRGPSLRLPSEPATSPIAMIHTWEWQ